MITAIVLSAGESRRMGRQKVLLPYGGRTVIEHIVLALQDGGADEIVAVTGHEGDRVASAVGQTSARIAFNGNYRAGMLASVRCGLRAASFEAEAYLVALGDQPSIRAAIVERLVHEFRGASEPVILAPTYGGRRGHPLLFSRHFREQVLTRFDDVGLRGLPAAHPDAMREVPVADDAVLRDMDVPADYANELDALEEDRRTDRPQAGPETRDSSD